MVHQIRLGRQGWLESNYQDLARFQAQNSGKIQIAPARDLKSFNIIIAGINRFQGHYLNILCFYPHPGQPPRFELVNAAEIGRLNHAHIKDIYVCLKAPWTPNTPLSAPLRAICKAWWRPTH